MSRRERSWLRDGGAQQHQPESRGEGKRALLVLASLRSVECWSLSFSFSRVLRCMQKDTGKMRDMQPAPSSSRKHPFVLRKSRESRESGARSASKIVFAAVEDPASAPRVRCRAIIIQGNRDVIPSSRTSWSEKYEERSVPSEKASANSPGRKCRVAKALI